MGYLSTRTPVAVSLLALTAALAGCGGGGYGSSSPPATTATSGSGSSASASAKFSVANVSGVGNVVVDGRGRTVYILTSGGHTNVPCTAASGCTKLWPTLPLKGGATAAKAGSGLNASLLGTKTVGGATYPTVNGWLVYEYAGDTASGQAKGQGISSFGGTWYVLNASGDPVKSSGGSGGGGSGY